MSLSLKLRKYLLKAGATRVGYADISDVTIMDGLTSGVIFYVTYSKDVLKTMSNAPSKEYAEKIVEVNRKLDEIGLKCEEYLKNRGFQAYAQTRERLGLDFGEFNSFPLPHKTFATKAGLGWIGKSALLVTEEYGSALRLTSVLTDAPLEYGKPVITSQCGDCNRCREACQGNAILGVNWNTETLRNEFYDDRKCKEFALKISGKNLGSPAILCAKCMYACPYTQRYMKS